LPSVPPLAATPPAGAFVPGLATGPALDPSSLMAGGDVRAAIARAASATGVDFSYLMAQARLESSLNPRAANGGSSARGLYQFTKGTWAQTLSKHGDALDAALGGDGSGAAALPGAMADPATRARLMALRNDPDASAMMAAELAGDNQVALTNALGRTPDPAELYLAHFLGSDGATKFLSALSTNPDQSAAALLPRAAAANGGIFFDAGGAPRSVGAVMMLMRARMAAAMADTPAGAAAAAQPSLLGGPVFATTDVAAGNGQSLPPDASGGPIAQEFAAAQGQASGTSSMAETLSATFGLASSDGAVPGFVRTAYGRMAALGL